ncbi:serine hydrolase [Chryseobacterium pennipullorum]|uniref:Serine hydrolase n=1 Tax=Chryseobacterium pennipullorum TaxID=2258963 RepID=A0A3D9APV7_9FLAO|nr:serine hydrolase [Chryseobacterium pennipullorum]REC43370.1 serine hydrolase [Chryseobacterium pennipullorum]
MRTLLTCVVVLLTATSLYSQKTKQLEKLLAAYGQNGQFSGSVLVAEKGKIIFEKSYGYRNGPKKEKNTNNSLYRIFSTTKMFTATVILKLEEQGKLSLQDKLSKYYPDFPKGDSITVAHLLSHTSGIPSEQNTDHTVDEKTFIQYISGKPLEFSPGSQWNYSNSGYYILGYIIKKVTGSDYDQVIENYILKPLQMNHTGFHFNMVTDENKAFGYEFLSDNASSEAFRFKTDHPFAAGAMYSTVGDLFKFNEAIKNHQLLKKETLEKAFTPYLKEHYGLGIVISSVLGKKAVGHDGGGPGYRSRYYRVLEDDLCIIVITNSELSRINLIVSQMENILYNKPYNIPTAAKIPLQDLKKLEGVYSTGDTEFYITVTDGQVVFREKNNPRCLLYPISSTYFQLDETFTFTFKPNKAGEIDALTVRFSDGKIKTGKRQATGARWGIIGDATPSGWDGKDIPLQSDPKNPKIFFLKNYPLKKGKFKFRFDNDWGYVYGLSDDGKSIALEAYDLHIVEDGKYDIVFDTTHSIKPQYNIRKSVQ